jgi:hypothetical protein
MLFLFHEKRAFSHQLLPGAEPLAVRWVKLNARWYKALGLSGVQGRHAKARSARRPWPYDESNL